MFKFSIDKDATLDEAYYDDDSFILWNIIHKEGDNLINVTYPVWCRDSLGAFAVAKNRGVCAATKSSIDFEFEFERRGEEFFKNTNFLYALYGYYRLRTITRFESLLKNILNPLEIQAGYTPTGIIHHQIDKIEGLDKVQTIVLEIDNSYFDSPFTISLITAIYRLFFKIARSEEDINHSLDELAQSFKYKESIFDLLIFERITPSFLLVNSKKFIEKHPLTGRDDSLLDILCPKDGSNSNGEVRLSFESIIAKFPAYKVEIALHNPLFYSRAIFYGELGFRNHMIIVAKLLSLLEREELPTSNLGLNANLISISIVNEYLKTCTHM